MKIRHIICMALLMAVAGACKKNQETSSFSASIEIDESKTYLDGMKVKWSAGDQIIVYGNGDSKTYGLSAGASTQTGTFTTTGGVQPANTYRAFYPSTSCTGVSGDIFTFTIPATQTYTAGGFNNNLNPMAGKNDGNGGTLIGFRNACAVLKVNATGNNFAITSIELTTTGSAYQLSGTFTFDYVNKTTALSSGTGNTITLSGINTTLTSTAQTFYFVVPPQALANGFTVTYKNGNTSVATKTVTAAQVTDNYTLAPNKMLNLSVDIQVTGVVNLLPNMIPANWYVSSGATLTASNNGAINGVKFTNSSSSEVYLRPSNPATAPLIKGHTYYVRFYVKMSNFGGTQTFDFYWPEHEQGRFIGGNYNPIGDDNKWKMYSRKWDNFNPAALSDGDYSSRIDFNGLNSTRVSHACGAMLIDLTAATASTGTNYAAMSQSTLDGKAYFYGTTPTW